MEVRSLLDLQHGVRDERSVIGNSSARKCASYIRLLHPLESPAI
jgi:hypothetical protein